VYYVYPSSVANVFVSECDCACIPPPLCCRLFLCAAALTRFEGVELTKSIDSHTHAFLTNSRLSLLHSLSQLALICVSANTHDTTTTTIALPCAEPHPTHTQLFSYCINAYTTAGTVMSSFESMSPTLDQDHWGIHGGAPIGPTNVMMQRNHPCDNIIESYFGNHSDFNEVGQKPFQKQLWQCMVGQALNMKQRIELRRSLNHFGIIVWCVTLLCSRDASLLT